MTNKELIKKFKNGATKGIAAHLYIKDNKLINYDTIIAYKDNDNKIHLNVRKYGASTAKIQNICKSIFDNLIVEEYEGPDYNKWDYGSPSIKAKDIY